MKLHEYKTHTIWNMNHRQEGHLMFDRQSIFHSIGIFIATYEKV